MKKIKIDIYDQEVLVFNGIEDYQKWVRKNPVMDGEELFEKMSYCAGLAGAVASADGENGYWFIFLEEKDTCTISHEACHIAYMLTDVLGIQHDAGNHEAYAYLQGFIFSEVCKVLKIPTSF